MPTYEYRCRSCGHTFEKFQPITAKPVKRCPACGKNSAERLIGTGAGIIFKGSGFYETDYRSDSYKQDAKKESGSSEKSEGSAGKGDSRKERGKAGSPPRRGSPERNNPRYI